MLSQYRSPKPRARDIRSPVSGVRRSVAAWAPVAVAHQIRGVVRSPLLAWWGAHDRERLVAVGRRLLRRALTPSKPSKAAHAGGLRRLLRPWRGGHRPEKHR